MATLPTSKGRVLSTGVGSLPFATADKAVKHVFAHYGVPFFPQVPRAQVAPDGLKIAPMLREVLTPTMLEALRAGDAPSVIGALRRESERDDAAVALVQGLPGFAAFVERLRDRDLAKLQLAGPFTLRALLKDRLPAAPDDELLEACWTWTEQLTQVWAGQARRQTGLRLLLIWDDALLAVKGGSGDRTRFARLGLQLARESVTLGLHSCSPMPVTALTEGFPGAALSVDASVIDVLSPQARLAVGRHLQQGGKMLFGVFDTRSQGLDLQKGLMLGRQVVALARGAAPEAEVLLTGGCGTGLHKEVYEEALAEGLRAACALGAI